MWTIFGITVLALISALPLIRFWLNFFFGDVKNYPDIYSTWDGEGIWLFFSLFLQFSFGMFFYLKGVFTNNPTTLIGILLIGLSFFIYKSVVKGVSSKNIRKLLGDVLKQKR